MPDYLLASPDGIAWLTLLLFSPLVGAAIVVIAMLTNQPDQLVKRGVVAWMFVPLGIALYVWAGYDPTLVRDGQGVIQFVERVPWIRAVQVDYFLGIDGISLPMVLLTVVMAPIAALSAFSLTKRVKEHFAVLLLLEWALLGYFLALDFFFFFIFWEFSLVPAFFLILMWGRSNLESKRANGESTRDAGSDDDPFSRRRHAAVIFFIYTMAGSLGLLLLFQFIYLATKAGGFPTFDLIVLGRLGSGLPVAGAELTLSEMFSAYAAQLGITAALGTDPLIYTGIAFWAIFIAFAIKLGVWPLHIWLPAAYSEAPTAASILLAAVMSKMGAYGMLRLLLPMVPDAAQHFAPVMAALALIGIVAGAGGALAQAGGDIKRLIGYTSINHMGYVMLAIAAAAASGAGTQLSEAALQTSRTIALNGAIMQMVAHGLSTGGLFLLAAWLMQRGGSYRLADYGGLRTAAPVFAGVFGATMFANLGLPGLAGFVGEFFIFRGAWATLPLFTLCATIGLVVTALGLLLMQQQIFFGELNPNLRNTSDLTPNELGIIAPLLALLLVLGIYPAPLLSLSNTVATQVVQIFDRLLA